MTNASIAIEDDKLTRRSGPFHREEIGIHQLRRVVAINRDALTHDEILVGLFDGDGRVVWLSEFDEGFADVLTTLARLLPGIGSLEGVTPTTPFESCEKTLWTANQR